MYFMDMCHYNNISINDRKIKVKKIKRALFIKMCITFGYYKIRVIW